MDARQFEDFIKQVGQLTRRQREKIVRLLHDPCDQGGVVELIEQAARTSLACPRCKATAMTRHGQAHGLQRFRCKACAKTFNALTGTPLAHLRYKSKWLDYMECLLTTRTVRKAADYVDVHRNTSFRWRHRFLTLPKTDRPLHLHGITEADEIYFLESEKGARYLERPPHKRGGPASKRGISNEQVCVLVARDRTGQTIDFVAGKGPVTKAQLKRCLPPVVDEDILLVSDSNAAYRYFARDAGISHQAVNLRQGQRVRGAIHVQNVNAYHSRLREWLDRFHGVATHYLPNYLGWRWALDAQRIDSPDLLLRTALGDFQHLPVT